MIKDNGESKYLRNQRSRKRLIGHKLPNIMMPNSLAFGKDLIFPQSIF